ncbi:hypothetical protein [Winogradskyella wichelsiae]|uniref:hypothetical protein n=1 Tax=Winogradskyella wichelsiae TaxID=2697007 RepID=UPI0015CE8333|nr:hypothetical protein [Winogradskyella wichelsiae]
MTFTKALVKVIFLCKRNPNPYQSAQTRYKHIIIHQRYATFTVITIKAYVCFPNQPNQYEARL